MKRVVGGLIGEHYVTYGEVHDSLATSVPVTQSLLAESSFVDCSKQSIDLNRAIGNRARFISAQLIATCLPVRGKCSRPFNGRGTSTQMSRKWTKTKSLLLRLCSARTFSLSLFPYFVFFFPPNHPAISQAFSSIPVKRVLPERAAASRPN